jgi:tetratricopeptide (TPR) repeat protein
MSLLNRFFEKQSKTKELFAQLRALDPELQGLTILQALNRLYDIAEKKDRKPCALAYLGLQYLQHSLHFHEPEFGTGEAIAYALYNLHKPRLQKLRDHYLAMYGENTIKLLQRCVDASLMFFTEAIKLEPEFGWAYYWRTSVYRYMLDMPKAQKDIQKARELWWDDENMGIGEILNYIEILKKEDARLDNEFQNLYRNRDREAAMFAHPLVQNKARLKLVPMVDLLNEKMDRGIIPKL